LQTLNAMWKYNTIENQRSKQEHRRLIELNEILLLFKKTRWTVRL